MSFDDVLPHEMDGTIRDDEGSDPLDGAEGDVGVGDHALFEEDLRTAFPEIPIAQRTAEDHFTAMVGAIQLLADKGDSALEPTRNAHGPDRRVSGLPKQRRRTMPKRLIAKLAVAMAMLLSLAGLANAGMLPDPIQKPIANVLGFDTDDADDQGEDADDQGEDADVDGDEVEHGGLVGADPDADDQGGDSENQADDDQGEDADDQGEDSHSEEDDEGEDGDDQGEDADDQGEDSHSEDDDEGGDSHSEDDDEGGDSHSEDDDEGGDSDQ